MKTKNIKLFLLVLISITMIRCEYQETDFGFTGSIKGTVQDNDGNPLHGDLSSNNLLIKLLGEGDEQAIEIRVKGDGTFQNNKMYPKPHKVWVEGPIVNSDTVTLDFSGNASHVQDFTVTPLISSKIENGSADGNSINVEYSIAGNAGNTVEKMEIYCSTVQYPTAAIGSRENFYYTKTVSLSSLSGNVTIDELESGTKYYLRIGAKASDSPLMNYSNQIEVTP